MTGADGPSGPARGTAPGTVPDVPTASPTVRVLLISPQAFGTENNGDMQYTADLLADPPPGVAYVSLGEALEGGELLPEPSWRRSGSRPTTIAGGVEATARLGLVGLRRLGWLLPDDVHWWRVAGNFDLVHVHCLPVRLGGEVPPLVVTDSAGTFWYWTAAKGLGEPEVWRMLRRERRAARALGYIHPSVNTDRAQAVLLFVEEGLDLLGRIGLDRRRAGVAPPGVPPASVARRRHDRPTLLFVARNFEIKGGPAVLDIFATVRDRLPDARLIVAGSDRPDPRLDGVSWLGPLSRAELYESVYPESDVFVYPTTFDCAPLVVMEAMAHGIPVVAPRAFGLPSMVGDGEGGILHRPGDRAAAAADTLALLVDPDRAARMSAGARDAYEARLSTRVRNETLGATYRRIVSDPLERPVP
jgi:glycosyltransferase involved in cell wall biosynthesis